LRVLKPEDLEETIIEKPTTHPRTNGPNENQIGDRRGVSTLICVDETYRILLSISQAKFTKKQFKYLIETMQLYNFTDEQWNNLKAILTDNKDGFTDDQWKMVNQLLSQNRLNDEQFGIFVDMLDTSTQNFHLLNENRLNDDQFRILWICLTLQHKSWYYCMQVEEQEKLLLHVKSLKSWPGKMKFVVARVQPGLALCTYHRAELSMVFSRHGHQV
jgi:hypothetical protein